MLHIVASFGPPLAGVCRSTTVVLPLASRGVGRKNISILKRKGVPSGENEYIRYSLVSTVHNYFENVMMKITVAGRALRRTI